MDGWRRWKTGWARVLAFLRLASSSSPGGSICPSCGLFILPSSPNTKSSARPWVSSTSSPALWSVPPTTRLNRKKPPESEMSEQKLVTPREAAQILGVSYPTLKQWIYKRKLRTVKTAGGHHRIPESELDRFLHTAQQRGPVEERRRGFRRISVRNQLVARVTAIKLSGLIPHAPPSIGAPPISTSITPTA